MLFWSKGNQNVIIFALFWRNLLHAYLNVHRKLHIRSPLDQDNPCGHTSAFQALRVLRQKLPVVIFLRKKCSGMIRWIGACPGLSM